jgi:cytochrome P450
MLTDLQASLVATAPKASADAPASILAIVTAHLLPLSDILSESLRLHPPIPTEIAQHIGKEPLCLPSGQIVTPGEFITWSPWVMARLPSIWGATATDFDPSRWAKMREQGEKKSVYELPTFHAGPRACLGRDMAKLVMLVTLRAVLERYDIDGIGERQGRLGVGFTGEMEGGLRVRLRLRKGRE